MTKYTACSIIVYCLAAHAALAAPPAKDAKTQADYIKVEVKGRLLNNDSSYVLLVRLPGNDNARMELQLEVSEEKALVRRLDRLKGQEVLVRGYLAQIHTNKLVALGVRHGFRIEAASKQ